MAAKLIARSSILYLAHQYNLGDELPTSDKAMVQAWLDAGTAEWKEDDQEAPKKAPKAKPAAAQSGVAGMSTSGNPEDLAGRITKTPEREKGEAPKKKRTTKATK